VLEIWASEQKGRLTVVDKGTSDEALVFQASDHAYYAIPWDVVEQGRLPVSADPAAGAEDVEGYGQRALLPYVEDGSYFALAFDVIQKYRLPEAQAAKLGGLFESDVVGYAFGKTNAFGPSDNLGDNPGFSSGNLTIINQYNINVGINLAFNSPGAVMGINQLGLNTFS
jgi:hypothetical protein